MKLLFLELENGLKDKESEINARIEARFSKLEASQRNDIEVTLAKLEYNPPSSKPKRQRLIKGKHLQRFESND